MKKNLIFIIIAFFLGCTSQKELITYKTCPEVFFSKNHDIYITADDGQIGLDNIAYKAKINNYNFDKKCQVLNNKLSTILSFLVIVDPYQTKKESIQFPYYLAVFNEQRKIIDIQFFKFTGNFNLNIDQSSYIETEVIETLNLNIPYADEKTGLINKIIIGFMLDKEKLKIIN